MPCGTSGGVLVHFPLVEIIHRLHPASVVRYERGRWREKGRNWKKSKAEKPQGMGIYSLRRMSFYKCIVQRVKRYTWHDKETEAEEEYCSKSNVHRRL